MATARTAPTPRTRRRRPAMRRGAGARHRQELERGSTTASGHRSGAAWIASRAPRGRACPSTSMSTIDRTSLTPCSIAWSCTISPPISTHPVGRRGTRSPSAAHSATVSGSSRSISIALKRRAPAPTRASRENRRFRAGRAAPPHAARAAHRLGEHAATVRPRPSESGSGHRRPESAHAR